MAREDVDGLLCWLKGPALAVLLVVGRDGGATHAELSAATGWARNTTYTALGKLVDGGLLRRDEDGRWLLTKAGGRAWAELTGATPAVPEHGTNGGGAGAGAVPESGTAGNGVPQNGRKRRPVPANGTKKGKPAPRSGRKRGKAVPENGTKTGRPVPESGTARAKSVPGNGTTRPGNGRKWSRSAPRNGRKQPGRVPENGTAPYVDHDDHVVDDDQTSINNIIQRLEALPGPFGGAAEWAPQQERKVTVAWLEHLETAPPEVLARYTNPTGLLRTRVEQGIWPPRLPDKRPEQRTCAQCGHSMWDVDGSCLVCSGVVKY